MKIGGNGNSAILSGTSSPDGVVSAPKGTLYVNRTTGSVWQNTDGATAWRPFGARQFAWQDGRYYFTPLGTTGAGAATNNVLRVSPVYIPNQVTITRLGAEITAAGEAGSKLRLGIYNDDGTGRPGALALDAGTIAGDSATVQEITGLSTMIGPGWYWFGGAVQSAPTSTPSVRTVATLFYSPSFDVGASAPGAGASFVGMSVNSVSGALPSTFGSPSASGSIARTFVKVGT